MGAQCHSCPRTRTGLLPYNTSIGAGHTPATPALGQGLPYHVCTGPGTRARQGIMIVGTLWLFPGAIAHLVMRTVVPAGAPASEEPRPRISVAVNYTLAPHPAPHSAPFCAFESETHSDTSCAAECRAG